MKNRVTNLILLLLLFFGITTAHAQEWNKPDTTFIYSAPNTTADSMVIWTIKYDTSKNVSISSNVTPYLGNSGTYFHTSISDVIVEPFEVKPGVMGFVITLDTSGGYMFYAIDMKNINSKPILLDKYKIVVSCACINDINCCVPQEKPNAMGYIEMQCSPMVGSGKCNLLNAFLIDEDSKRTGVEWTGSTLIVKAKGLVYIP